MVSRLPAQRGERIANRLPHGRFDQRLIVQIPPVQFPGGGGDRLKDGDLVSQHPVRVGAGEHVGLELADRLRDRGLCAGGLRLALRFGALPRLADQADRRPDHARDQNDQQNCRRGDRTTVATQELPWG